MSYAGCRCSIAAPQAEQRAAGEIRASSSAKILRAFGGEGFDPFAEILGAT
jgi:hypothetical protein